MEAAGHRPGAAILCARSSSICRNSNVSASTRNDSTACSPALGLVHVRRDHGDP